MPRAVTPRKSVELERSRTPLLLAGLLVVGLGLTAGAIAWGKSDAGEINVAATINNSHTGGDTGSVIQQAATPEHSALPNGGLVAADGNSNPPPAPPVEEVGSTTTEGEEGEAGEVAEETTETRAP